MRSGHDVKGRDYWTRSGDEVRGSMSEDEITECVQGMKSGNEVRG